MSAQQLITEHIDLWTSTIKAKKTQGRGSNKKRELYGVKKLRELILELAVRGKLVPQNPSDEPASVLLERIAAEKALLIKDKKIKKQKPLPEITNEEEPFELHKSWSWLRFPDAFYPISVGQNKVKTSEIQEEGDVPVVDQGQSFIAGYIDKENLEIKLPGPVIIFGDHTSSLKYIDFNFIAGADGVKILRPICCNERYFYLVSKTLPIENRGYGRHYSRFVDNLFPLPPLEEQPRIVAKVDELMALCDQLEQQTESSLDAHNLLVDTLLSTLTNARDAKELRDNWARLADHFDTLITTDYAVEQLKQTILQLAVMGKLVPQDPNDEPASELLKRIAAEKAQLIKDKKIKKQKPLPEITDEEKRLTLPSGWEGCKLKELITLMDAGWSPACPPEPSPSDDIWGVLKTTAVQAMEYRQYENKVLSSNKEPKPQFEVRVGDILITRAGPKNRVGVSCLVQSTRPKLMISDKIIRFHLVEVGMYERYVSLCLNAGATAEYLEAEKSGMAESQMNISQDKLKAAPIPLCPIKEQYRIVAKVDELMALCDQLKAQLNNAQTTQLHLSDAVVENALTA